MLVKLKFKKLIDTSQGEGRRESNSSGRESSTLEDPGEGGSTAFTRSGKQIGGAKM